MQAQQNSRKGASVTSTGMQSTAPICGRPPTWISRWPGVVLGYSGLEHGMLDCMVVSNLTLVVQAESVTSRTSIRPNALLAKPLSGSVSHAGRPRSPRGAGVSTVSLREDSVGVSKAQHARRLINSVGHLQHPLGQAAGPSHCPSLAMILGAGC